MDFELFVEQPNIELKQGVKVTKETDVTYVLASNSPRS